MSTIPSAILDELVDRWLTKVATLVALYVTFRGHNAPGGGFAGGLILGSAFVLQYLTGREPMLRGRPIRHPEALLGAGLLLALVTTAAPLLVGGAPLESHIWPLDVPAREAESSRNGTAGTSRWMSIRSRSGPETLPMYFSTCGGVHWHCRRGSPR